ncbi:recombinase family protein [Gordonia sp. SND2]|uniref:recombinase family protein n=1 Tax=Gordonia sp. SND2 TaxID=3388659 RepID=UPI00398B6E4D
MSRAYGWTVDGQIIDTEADTIRRVADLVLDGTPVRAIANTLNREGITTGTGATWAIPPITRMLKNPRLIGKRDEDGHLVDNPAVPAILDEDRWVRINEILSDSDRQKHTRKPHRKHLLTGVCRCGVCGEPAYPSGTTVRASCSHVQATTAAAEAEITERLLARVTSRPWLDAVQQQIDRGSDHYRSVISMADDRIEVLAKTFGGGTTDAAAFEAGVAAAREVRAEAESSLALIDVVDRFPSLTDEDVVRWWADESTPLEDRRALIASVIDHVDILPLRESSDRDRFVVHWR